MNSGHECLNRIGWRRPRLPRRTVACGAALALALLPALDIGLAQTEPPSRKTGTAAPERTVQPAQAELPANLLAISDLKNPRALAVKLRDAQDPLSDYLRERCSIGTRQLLSIYKESAPPDELLQQALVGDLNRLLRGVSLYDPTRFARVTLADETRKLLEKNPQGEERLRLNRLLLEDAYPNELAQSRAAPIDIRADSMEYDHEKNLVIASGHVVVRRGEEFLRSDSAIVNRGTYDVLAEGHVSFERGSDAWTGNKLRYNFITHKGDFGQFVAFLNPFYVQAASSQRISEQEYLVKDAILSTCEGDSPNACFYVRSARISPSHDISAQHVVLFIGGVPVMYAPYWHQNLGDPNFISIVPGYSHRMYAFLLTAFNYRISRHIEAATHVDLRLRRGVGVGQDVMWSASGNAKGLSTERVMDRERAAEYGPVAFAKYSAEEDRKVEEEDAWFGDLTTYYIRDSWPDEDKDQSYAIDNDRYRMRLYHSQAISDQDFFLTQINYLSDPEIIHQFFRDEYKASPEPENYLALEHRGRHYAASLWFQRRLNDFYTSVNRFPEAALDFSRQKIWESPFYYQGKTMAAYLEKQWERNLTNNQDYAAVRFDSAHMIYYPTKQFDFLTIMPRAGYRGTWFSKTKENYTSIVETTTTGTNGLPVVSSVTNILMRGLDAAWRNVGELGLETSFKAFKVWEAYPGDIINNVRHIAEPYANYTYVPEPNVETNSLYQFDDVDGISQNNSLRLGMRNKFQTKRKTVYDLVNADIWTTWLLDPTEGQNSFGNIAWDVRSAPFDWLDVKIDGTFDEYENMLDTLNTRATVHDRKFWSFSMEHRYNEGSSSLLDAAATVTPWINWQLGAFSRYEFKDSTLEAYGLSVQRTMDCIATRVGYEWEDDDFSFWIQLWFTSFSKVKLDVGL